MVLVWPLEVLNKSLIRLTKVGNGQSLKNEQYLNSLFPNLYV